MPVGEIVKNREPLESGFSELLGDGDPVDGHSELFGDVGPLPFLLGVEGPEWESEGF